MITRVRLPVTKAPLRWHPPSAWRAATSVGRQDPVNWPRGPGAAMTQAAQGIPMPTVTSSSGSDSLRAPTQQTWSAPRPQRSTAPTSPGPPTGAMTSHRHHRDRHPGNPGSSHRRRPLRRRMRATRQPPRALPRPLPKRPARRRTLQIGTVEHHQGLWDLVGYECCAGFSVTH